LAGFINTLVKTGRVEVGWRECCGKTDSTMYQHREWVKIVSMLRKDGVVVNEEQVKHKNAYATNNGGFWNSIIYSVQEEKGLRK